MDSIRCRRNPSSSTDSHLDSLEAAGQVGFVYHPYIVQPYAVQYSYKRSGRSSSCGGPPKPINEPSSTSIMDYEVAVACGDVAQMGLSLALFGASFSRFMQCGLPQRALGWREASGDITSSDTWDTACKRAVHMPRILCSPLQRWDFFYF